MVLSDQSIREALEQQRIVIDPLDPEAIQPSSVDLHIGDQFLIFRKERRAVIDLREPPKDLMHEVNIPSGEAFVLHPGEFALGSTLERLGMPDDLVARLEGKSSLGRLGLLIHSTAGFIDPGFDGQLTLELSNVARLPITIYPGMPIGQVSFWQMSTPAQRPYGSKDLGSKYQGQRGPTASAMHRTLASRGLKPT